MHSKLIESRKVQTVLLRNTTVSINIGVVAAHVQNLICVVANDGVDYSVFKIFS